MDGPGVVILNPVAAQGRILRVWPKIKAALLQVLPQRPDVWESQHPGHAVELAQRAALEGYEWIAVCGGDGTVHEVVNGICRARFHHGLQGQHPSLTVIPAGTGNDFARSLGIPLNAVTAALGLSEPVNDTIDVGRVGDHYFANIAGAGFDAEVAAEVNRSGKKAGGALPYVWGVIKKLFVYQNQDLRIQLDDQILDRRALLVAVGISPYYAGGMHILPKADPRDGLFDVCICGDLRRIEVLSLLPRIFSGGHVGHRQVEFYRARKVKISGSANLHVQADGEIVGKLPVEFECLPGTLRVVKPVAVAPGKRAWQAIAEKAHPPAEQERLWPPT